MQELREEDLYQVLLVPLMGTGISEVYLGQRAPLSGGNDGGKVCFQPCQIQRLWEFTEGPKLCFAIDSSWCVSQAFPGNGCRKHVRAFGCCRNICAGSYPLLPAPRLLQALWSLPRAATRRPSAQLTWLEGARDRRKERQWAAGYASLVSHHN